MNVVPLSLHSEFKTKSAWPQPRQTGSVFPADAHAIIYKPAPSAMSSGRARGEQWRLRFERRYPQQLEPLIGWTADDDPLSQVELSFPSAQSAIAYARRQGLRYTVQGLLEEAPQLRLVSNRSEPRGPASGQHRKYPETETSLNRKAG